MRALNPRALNALTILNLFSAYLIARLLANPLLEAVLAVARQAHEALYSALQAFWSAQQALMAAVSALDAAVYRLDGAFRGLRTAVLVYAHNDRNSKIYTALFHGGFSELIRRNAAEKLVLARDVLRQVAEYPDPLLTGPVQALQTAVDTLSSAVESVDGARLAKEDATRDLATAKQRYCVRYEDIFHQLVSILGERRQADTYFRRPRRREAAEVITPSQPQPVPEPVPATGGLTVGTSSDRSS